MISSNKLSVLVPAAKHINEKSSADMKSYVGKVTTATGTFKHFFFLNLNVQAELNIVGNFGLFRPKIKHLENQQPEKND